MPSQGGYEVRIAARIAELPRDAWEALVPDDARPFLSWDFIDTLESTGCATAERGWQPAHVAVFRDGALVAASPGYVKGHSLGEFMYNDFRWPPVAARFGVAYYPKLILSVPFSPCTGPRVLHAPSVSRADAIAVTSAAALHFAKDAGLSSVSSLFVPADDLAYYEAAGLHSTSGVQFHWENEGYATFDAFLAKFNAKRRHMLRTECAQPAKDGTTIRTYRGADLTDDVLAFASRCYEATSDKHAWNGPHLNEAFFLEAGRRLRDRVEVVLAEEGGQKLGAAFNLRGDKRLYGRQWGAVSERRFLHFNVCYYHSIARCITDGLEAFEPGAGGEHKMPRGFAPAAVHSVHRFLHPELDAFMAPYLDRERDAVARFVLDAREQRSAFRGGLTAG